MRFTIVHELDAPLDAVELALLSPELGPRLGQKVSTLEGVVTVEHAIEAGELRRVLRFQANAPLPVFKGRDLAREAMAWEEIFTYQLTGHAATWHVAPMALRGGARSDADASSVSPAGGALPGGGEAPAGGTPEDRWRQYFRAEGTYRLEPLPGGRTRRSVEGSLDVHVAVIGSLVERMALAEIRKTYDAEAETLRELSVV